MDKITNPTPKGSIVAVEQRHSYQHFKEGRQEYVRFYLGTVTKAKRDGAARKIALGASSVSSDAVTFTRVYALSGPMQEAAARLVANMSYPGTEWETAEDMKAAIKAEHDNPAPVRFAEYREFKAADEAFSRVLNCEFGARAGDVRYTREAMGEPDSVLRSTYDRREAARKAWEAILPSTMVMPPEVQHVRDAL